MSSNTFVYCLFEADRLANHLVCVLSTKKKAEEAIVRWTPLISPGNSLFIETWRVNGERPCGSML
jgi:hypothetical protein